MSAQVRLTLVAVALSACLTSAEAETQDSAGSLVRQELCAPGAPEVRSKIPLDGLPVYFDRNIPNGSGVVVAFANQDGTQSNYLIDLKTGKKTQIPGVQDGIPSPDGEIYTTPYTLPPHYLNQAAMAIYRMKGLSKDSTPILIDGQMDGEYPSLAVIGRQAGHTLYRLLETTSDDKGSYFAFRDYSDPPLRQANMMEIRSNVGPSLDYLIEKENQWIATGAEVFETPTRGHDRVTALKLLKRKIAEFGERKQLEGFLQSEPLLKDLELRIQALDYVVEKVPPKRFCQNYASDSLMTPMLAKDGTRVSAFNVNTQTTQILYLDGKSGKCSETLNGDPKTKIDLGRATGKADFSFDGKIIAFHLQDVLAGKDNFGWIQQPTKGDNFPAYTYDLQSGRPFPLAAGPNDAYMYPAFFNNGLVSVLHFYDGGKKAEIVVLKTTSSQPVQIQCQSGGEQAKPTTTLPEVCPEKQGNPVSH